MGWLLDKVIKPWHPTLIGIVVVSLILFVGLPNAWPNWGWLPLPDREYVEVENGVVFDVVEERRFRMLPLAEWGFSYREAPRCVPTIGREKRGRYGLFEMTDFKWQYMKPLQ